MENEEKSEIQLTHQPDLQPVGDTTAVPQTRPESESVEKQEKKVDDDGFPLDAKDGKLSYSRLLYNANRAHPRKQVKNEDGEVVLEHFPIWGTKTGCLGCRPKDRQSDLSQQGPGTVIFFQLFKSMCCIYAFMFILAIPSMFIYSWRKAPADYYLGSLVKVTSIQNLGESDNACAIIDNPVDGEDFTFELTCAHGTLTRISQLGLAKTQTTTCSKLKNPNAIITDFNFLYPECSYSNLLWDEVGAIDDTFSDQCYGKDKCTLTIFQSDILFETVYVGKQCKTQLQHTQQTLITAFCHNPDTVSLLGIDNTDDTVNTQIIANFDALITLTMFIGMIFLKSIIKTSEQEIQDEIINAQDFTVMIKCEKDTTSTLAEQRAAYWNWAQELMDQDTNVVKVPNSDQPDNFQNEVLSVEIGMNNASYLPLLKKIDEKVQQYMEMQESFDKMEEDEKKDKLRKKMDKAIEEIELLKIHSKMLSDRIEVVRPWCKTPFIKPDIYAVYAYITFRSMAGKEKFLQNFRMSFIQKNYLVKKFCKSQKTKEQQQKYFKGQWPQIEEDAPDPSMILWQNIGTKRTKRKTCVVYYFQFLLICYLFATIGFMTNTEEFVGQGFWTDDKCDKEANDVTFTKITVDQAKAYYQADNLDKVKCYCRQVYDDSWLGQFAILDVPNYFKSSCAWWQFGQTMKSYGIFLVGLVVAIFSDWCSGTAVKMVDTIGHHDLKQKLIARTNIVSIIATATSSVALILFSINWDAVNTYFPPFWVLQFLMSFTKKGDFIDFTWKWFATIGASIAVSNIISAASQIFALKPFFKQLFWRLYDRNWTKDRTKTRKDTQSDYEAMYTGEDFSIPELYSGFISVSLGIMMFGVAMPSLYFAGMLLCLLMYWVNKILYLRYSLKTPPFGVDQAINVCDWFQISSWIHMTFSIYILGSPSLMKNESAESDALYDIEIQLIQTLGWITSGLTGTSPTRYLTWGSIPIVRFYFWFTIVYVLEKNFSIVTKALEGLFKCCAKLEKKEEAYSTDMYYDLRAEGLELEFKMTTRQLKRYENLSKAYRDEINGAKEQESAASIVSPRRQETKYGLPFVKPERHIEEKLKESDKLILILKQKLKSIEKSLKQQIRRPNVNQNDEENTERQILETTQQEETLDPSQEYDLEKLMEDITKLKIQEGKGSAARIVHDHTYNIRHCKSIEISKDFEQNFKDAQVKAYLGGDAEKLTDLKNPILNSNEKTTNDMNLVYKFFCCLCLFFKREKITPYIEENFSEVAAQETMMGHPTLGPFLVDQRFSLMVKCFKCGHVGTSKTSPIFSARQLIWVITLSVIAIMFTFSIGLLLVPLIFLIPHLYGSNHRCRNCGVLIAQKQ